MKFFTQLYILFFILFSQAADIIAQTQVTKADIRVAYIYRFTEYIEWAGKSNSENFIIGVFDSDELMLQKFEYLANTKKIKNQNIEIVQIDKLNQIANTELDILYVGNENNSLIGDIFLSIQQKNTLLITDNCITKDAVMINLLPSAKERVVGYEINKKNIEDEGFNIHPDILLLGGSFIDVRNLFHNKELELEQEKEKLKSSKLEVEKQNEIIQFQDSKILEKEKAIAEKERTIKGKNSEILQKEAELKHQKQVLSNLLDEIAKKEQNINRKRNILNRQESHIIVQQDSIIATQLELFKQKTKIDNQLKLIAHQEDILTTQFSRIEQQQKLRNALLSVIFLVMGMVYFIYRSFRIKKRSNIKLHEYNNEITNQREELAAARDKLENINHELEKLSVVASKTNNAVIITDADRNIEWINDGYTKLFGYKHKELTHKFGSNEISRFSYPIIEKNIEICKKTKRTVEYLVQNITKKGDILWMHTSLTPILDENKNLKKLIVIEANVTELKKAEENIIKQKQEIEQQRDEIELQRDKVENQNLELEKYRNHLEKLVEARTQQLSVAKEKAEESDRLKSAFISNMSHEIRTPMNAVVGFSNLLGMPDLTSEDVENFINMINVNAAALIRLIDDIIDLSSIEAGRLTIKKSAYEVNPILNDLLLTYNNKISDESRQIELSLHNELLSKNHIIFTDKIRLNQVFVNLLDNALKFTEKGKVEFGCKAKDESSIIFYVSDSGIGIDKRQQKAIFERFLKIEEDTSKLYRGTGLGLAISKAIITDLGGEIWVESELGKGSKFIFSLPLN